LAKLNLSKLPMAKFITMLNLLVYLTMFNLIMLVYPLLV
jgi:hypothetical protein